MRKSPRVKKKPDEWYIVKPLSDSREEVDVDQGADYVHKEDPFSDPVQQAEKPKHTGPERKIEKGKRGGWRPGVGRPRKVRDPNDKTPVRRRYKPDEPRSPRGRPRKIRDPNDLTPVKKRYKPGEPRPPRGRPRKQFRATQL